MPNRVFQISDLASELVKCVPLPWVPLTAFPRGAIVAGIELARSQRENNKEAAVVCAALMNIWVHDIGRTENMGWCADVFTTNEILSAIKVAAAMRAEGRVRHASK